MKMITHKAAIETEILCSEDGLNTYELIKRLVGVKGKRATIVLLYPTRNKENMYSEDSTLNHLVNHMQELGINEIRVINLFSQVVHGKLSAKGLAVDEENMQYIDEIMKEPSFKEEIFIVAWGTSLSTSYAANLSKTKILAMFKQHCPRTKAYQLTTSNIDTCCDYAHPLFLGIRCSGLKWELEEFKVTAKMLVPPEKK